jgi:hypothetical protein
MEFLVVDWEENIFLLMSQLHLAMTIYGPGEEKFELCNLVNRDSCLAKLNGLFLELQIFL